MKRRKNWKLHARGIPEVQGGGERSWLLDKRMADGRFDLKKLAARTLTQRVMIWVTFSVVTTKSLSALRKQNGSPILSLRICVSLWGLKSNESGPNSCGRLSFIITWAIWVRPGGSTRVNAGGSFPQLSNCFLSSMMIRSQLRLFATQCGLRRYGRTGIGFTVTAAGSSPVKNQLNRLAQFHLWRWLIRRFCGFS